MAGFISRFTCVYFPWFRLSQGGLTSATHSRSGLAAHPTTPPRSALRRRTLSTARRRSAEEIELALKRMKERSDGDEIEKKSARRLSTLEDWLREEAILMTLRPRLSDVSSAGSLNRKRRKEAKPVKLRPKRSAAGPSPATPSSPGPA
jgi:hypothetical protein